MNKKELQKLNRICDKLDLLYEPLASSTLLSYKDYNKLVTKFVIVSNDLLEFNFDMKNKYDKTN